MLIGLLTHSLAAVLQLFAIIWALSLIPITGNAKAWLAFSAGFLLMGVRRVIEWLEHNSLIINNGLLNNLDDALALFTSVMFAIGIYLIRGIFEERLQAQHKLQQQLDELLRFQKVTVGRELRMKELAEENVTLRHQIADRQPGERQP